MDSQDNAASPMAKIRHPPENEASTKSDKHSDDDVFQGEESEDLDPRIQIELEKLNSSTDVINKLELDLEQARSTFRQLMDESGRHLARLQKEIGTSVEKARPYYEARMRARMALAEAQHAAARFEKASGAHEAAKEMVTLAEEGFQERGVEHFDQAWQEMLNHATTRVNDSEIEKNLSEEEHRVKSMAYEDAEKKVTGLQKSLKRSINKSRPYFEVKAQLNQSLDDQKRQIQVIEETIQMTKKGYADSLKELERISEEIHERRRRACIASHQHNQQRSGSAADATDSPPPPPSGAVRSAGVGAEFPSPSPIERQIRHVIQRQKSILSVSSTTTTAAAAPPSASGAAGAAARSSTSSVSSSTTESHDDVTASSLGDVTPLTSSAAETPKKAETNTNTGQHHPSDQPQSDRFRLEDISFDLTASPLRAACLANKSAKAKLNNKHLGELMTEEEEGTSDSDSLASMDMLGDDQIEQLMKDTSIQGAADTLEAIAK